MDSQINFLDHLFSQIKPIAQKEKQKKIKQTVQQKEVELFDTRIQSQFNECVDYKSNFNNQDIYSQQQTGETLQQGYQLIQNIVQNESKFQEKILNKNFLIQKFQKKLDFSKITKDDSKSKILINLRKQQKIFSIPPEASNYKLFEPLNKLWKQYIQEQIAEIRNEQELCLKLLKCDFHGCKIKILDSKCSSYEGQEVLVFFIKGIVVQETMRAFNIVTEQNRISKMLKQNSIFLIQLPDNRHVKVYGCHLLLRPSHRTKIKYKQKDASQFILETIHI